MPAGNDVEIVRVFTRQQGDQIAAVTHPVGEVLEIVLEAEAGTNIHGLGPVYTAGVIVRDLSDGTLITPVTNDATTKDNGHMNTAADEWPDPPYAIKYTVAPADLAGRENHVVEVLAFLTVGSSPPDASFATSPLFILTV